MTEVNCTARTLQDIYEDLKRSAEHRWHSRLLKKKSIEVAIAEYNVRLDDAARSFQVGQPEISCSMLTIVIIDHDLD